MSIKIYRDEVPDNITTENYIFTKTKSYDKWLKIKDSMPYRKFTFKLQNYNQELLAKDTLDALDKYKFEHYFCWIDIEKFGK